MPAGRPEVHIPDDDFKALCGRLAMGENLVPLCEEYGVTWNLFYTEIERNEEFSQIYERAQRVKAKTWEYEADAILSVPPPLTPDGKYDSAHVQWQKARADVKLRIAERLDPTRQKIDQKLSTPDGKNPFSITVDIRK